MTVNDHIEFVCGLFSRFPNTPWFAGLLGRGTYGELAAVGLSGKNRGSGKIILESSTDAVVWVYSCSCKLDCSKKLPTWNYYDPAAGKKWQQAGAKGNDDKVFLGRIKTGPDSISEIEVKKIPEAIIVFSDFDSSGLIDISGRIEV